LNNKYEKVVLYDRSGVGYGYHPNSYQKNIIDKFKFPCHKSIDVLKMIKNNQDFNDTPIYIKNNYSLADVIDIKTITNVIFVNAMVLMYRRIRQNPKNIIYIQGKVNNKPSLPQSPVDLPTKDRKLSSQINSLPLKLDSNSDSDSKKITLRDVAGYDDVKQELIDVIDCIKNPEVYKKIGAKVPNGILLYGAPGTGKTLLAKAVAGECGCKFISVSGTDFVEVYVGMGAARIRSLFKMARESGKDTIIFIDEIDSLGKRRSQSNIGGNEERESTLNQLLVELDGFDSKDNNRIVVLAATNRKDMLDPALLRPGRIDRQIKVPLPSIKDRLQILDLYLDCLQVEWATSQDSKKDKQKVTSYLASITPGFSAAQLSNAVNEAALHAVKNLKQEVNLSDLEYAIDKVAFGLLLKSDFKNDQKIWRVAVHEAGHCLASWFSPYQDPALKISITPRQNGVLGYAQQVESSSADLQTANHLYWKLVVLFAGRAAEELMLGTSSTGAHDDISKATSLAKSYFIDFGFDGLEHTLDAVFKNQPYNNEVVQQKMERLLRSAKEEADKLLRNKKPILQALSVELLTKKEMSFIDIYNCIKQKPSIIVPSSELIYYLENNDTSLLEVFNWKNEE